MTRIAPTTVVALFVAAALLPRPLAAQWMPLTDSLPSDSFEVRVSIISNLAMVRRDSSGAEKQHYPFRSFSIRRDASIWTARYVEKSGAFARSVEPRSQWHALWAKLVALDLLTLPDSAQLRDPAPVTDGVRYVVEINAPGQYRTYGYSNPEYQKWPEAKQLLQIVATLEDELLPKPWDLRWWWWPS